MEYPLSISDVDNLIDYVLRNPKDAELLSIGCFELISGSNAIIKFDFSIEIPNLPDCINKEDEQTIIITNDSIRDFLIVYKTNLENPDFQKVIDIIWKLKYKSKELSKIKNELEHLLILYNRLFKVDIAALLQKEGNYFRNIFLAFSNVLHLLELSIESLYLILFQFYNGAKGDIPLGILHTNLSKLAASNTELALALFELIKEKREHETIEFLIPLAEGLAKIDDSEKYFFDAKQLISGESTIEVNIGLQLLGNLEFHKKKDLEEAKGILIKYIWIRDEHIIPATTSMLKLIPQDNSIKDEILILSKERKDEFKYCISDYVWRNYKDNASEKWLKEVAINLVQTPTLKQGIIYNIVWHIEDALKVPQSDYAFRLLEEWFKGGQDPKTLGSCISDIAVSDFNLFCKFLTNCLGSGNINILKSIISITSIEFREKLKLDVQILDALSEDKVIRIIQAIIGFVYDKMALAQLLISIFDSTHAKTLSNEVVGVFSEYVCYTYPSTLESVVKPEHKTSKGLKRKALSQIINEVDKYYNALNKLPRLKEFSGSDKRKENFHTVFSKKNSSLMSKASEDSFLQFVKNIVMRTGPIWFGKFDGEYGRESEMKSIRVEGEMPRTEYIDPAGFEFYRHEMKQNSIKP